MKYIKFNLSDKTPVKFKIRMLTPYGLDIKWKYTNRLNFGKYIDLNVIKFQTEEMIEYLQQLTDEELISEYKGIIEEDHNKIKRTKKIIN